MNVNDIRRAILDTLPSETSLSGAPPKQESIYLPVAHTKALALENSLVVGARGVGKSFWWSALQDEKIRRTLEPYQRDLSKLFLVSAGHGEKPNIQSYPDMQTLDKLLETEHDPLQVWRAVTVRWLGSLVQESFPTDSWETTVHWVKDNPEHFAKIVERSNTLLKDKGQHALLLFDALDRTSHDWRTMDRIVRDLLHFLLYLKPFDHIHAKVFLREDQFEGRKVRDFPDASKLLATRVELTWGSIDLHGLLWQHLINGQGRDGEILRTIFQEGSGLKITQDDGVFKLPEAMRRDEKIQRSVFIKLAGERMGKDPRRGVPYTWVISHLADGYRRVSPRSFIAAIRNAAEDSLMRYTDYEFPLHHESIKRGVQKASAIRINEVQEDYPWIERLMNPLKGVTVPCEFSIIEQRWRDDQALDKSKYTEDRLPPERLQDGPQGVRQDLESLGIFERVKDDRVNMPDLYRVGFRLGRRGGVKPVPKG
ncbi:hypothetical protein [Anthocerotibacter panamensis]|uniref:hypothetical protein n=1 Tax=Anthocerotibacter panamensis TaxID=2857077 RepID=UPI001C408ACC|nr:hypothetical protein [Anthocerotibacter panamensis]